MRRLEQSLCGLTLLILKGMNLLIIIDYGKTIKILLFSIQLYKKIDGKYIFSWFICWILGKTTINSKMFIQLN